ncbi:hypothetical protein F4803DRAFT_547846 [Xylaria telfairii]|nr:hypothetical protein F4803DRAFT_547846 [Xylaria telfairii]
MDIVYNNDRPGGPQEEQLLSQGWKWVNTNTINPTQFAQKNTVLDANGRPDRLGEHSHHGESTHNIIIGDLRVQRTQEPRLLYEISTEPGAKRQDHVPPKTRYKATSTQGCTFAEGHRCLSPESAERFISRGTLRVVNKRPHRSFPTNNQLGIWLRQVKFNPDGKARPNLRMGEKPILDASRANPAMPEDVHMDLAEWFENEWRRPYELTALLRRFILFLLGYLILSTILHGLGLTSTENYTTA